MSGITPDEAIGRIRAEAARDIARAIWEDGQRCNAVLQDADPADPFTTHLHGRGVGLQCARDIAERLRDNALSGVGL